MSTTSSASPDELDAYSRAALDIDVRLRNSGSSLRWILEQFERECREYPISVRGMAESLVQRANDAQQTDAWVGRVAAGFRMADQGAVLMAASQPLSIPIPRPVPTPSPLPAGETLSLSDLERMIAGDKDYTNLINQLNKVVQGGGDVYELIETVNSSPKLRKFMSVVIKYQKGVQGARRLTHLGPINPGSLLLSTGLADLASLAEYTVGEKRYDPPERLLIELSTNHYIVLLSEISGTVVGAHVAALAVEVPPLAAVIFIGVDLAVGYAVEGGLEWLRDISVNYLIPDESVDRRRDEFMDDWLANTERYRLGELNYDEYQAAQQHLIEALGDATIALLLTDPDGNYYVEAACYERPEWRAVEVLYSPAIGPAPVPPPSPAPLPGFAPLPGLAPAPPPSPLPGLAPAFTSIPVLTPVPTPTPTSATSSEPSFIERRLTEIVNFVWGFIAGSGHEFNADATDYANEAAIAGDVVAGFVIWGDVRDVGVYIINALRPDADADEFVLALSLIGVVPGIGDVSGPFKSLVKTLDTLPKPAREAGLGIVKFSIKNMDKADEGVEVVEWLIKYHDSDIGKVATQLLTTGDAAKFQDRLATVTWLSKHSDEAAPLIARNLSPDDLTTEVFGARIKQLPVPASAMLPRPDNLYGYSDANMTHFLEGHTWDYIVPSQRTANSTSLWPEGTTPNDVRNALQEALDKTHAGGQVKAIAPGSPVQVTLDSGIKVQIGVNYQGEIGQFFPISGPGVETYSQGLLQTISTGLQNRAPVP